jgi:heme A synthase
VADPDRQDTESMPLTEPYTPTFDTGVHQKVEPAVIEPEPPRRRRWFRRQSHPAKTPDEPAAAYADAPPSESIPALSIADHSVRWWQFVLILWAVWIPAGAIGASLFYWWSHDPSKHKTTVVFVVLAYVVVSTVAGLILAVVADRPLVSALAIAMISAVFASVVGAAPVYGRFYCNHSQRPCLMRVIPH